MARLIFNSAEIVDTSGASFTTSTGSGPAVIQGIVVDSIEMSKEPTTVEIEDGRTLNESFAGSVTVRTVNTTTKDFGNADTNDGAPIFSIQDDSSNAVVSSNGSLPAAKAGLKLALLDSDGSAQAGSTSRRASSLRHNERHSVISTVTLQ